MESSRATPSVDPSTTAPDTALALHLSDAEREILELYDQLEELRLEIALLQAGGVAMNDELDAREVSEAEMLAAQRELLDAKASYSLRNSIVESVLVADPVLKAVHAGGNATPIERDLLPMVKARDDASVSLTEKSKILNDLLDELTVVEAEHMTVARKNRELTGSMLGLVQELGSTQREDVKDERARKQLEALETEVGVSRQRWRIIKGTVSGVVAGSGVDWARDEELRGLVLDEDEDDD